MIEARKIVQDKCSALLKLTSFLGNTEMNLRRRVQMVDEVSLNLVQLFKEASCMILLILLKKSNWKVYI